MFLGAGGAGKSSLLSGLMNRELKKAESTVLADTRTVSYQWVQAADEVDEAWDEYTSIDEDNFLVIKCRHWLNNKSAVVTPSLVPSVHYSEVAERLIRTSVFPFIPDVIMHVWDCGGQPIFLDILAAFLTQRTMFLFVFDSSIPLEDLYQEKWHHKGKVIPGREQHVTNQQLMIQWLQLVHSSLVVKGEGATIPLCPRAMIVGSHRDEISSEAVEAIETQLQSAYPKAAFVDIVVDRLLVDNTKAGKGKEGEDPGYKKIRNHVHTFAQSLIEPTPLSWVVFRQALQKASKSVLTYSEVCDVAKECKIPESSLKSVLFFFHQLGALLHYDTIPSLADTVIVKPQWLINQLKLLLMPEWYGYRSPNLKRLWNFLEEKGVLQEQLYSIIWKDCGLSGGPQAVVDLLEHFDLAVRMENCPDDISYYTGKKYYFPCMLQGNPNLEENIFKIEPIRQAATLHISFNMNYVPPGLFVRLIASIIQKGYVPLLHQEKIFRNGIVFMCGEIDQFCISESVSCLSVNILRISKRQGSQRRFFESCIVLRGDLSGTCASVLNKWMPSVTHTMAFKCTETGCKEFVPLTDDHHSNSTFSCSTGHKCGFSSQHKFWLKQYTPPKGSHFIEDGDLTEAEISILSNEIKEDNFMDLVNVMEMESSFDEAKSSVDSTDVVEHVLSEYAYEGGTRYQLAGYLKQAKFTSLSTKLLRGKFDPQTMDNVQNPEEQAQRKRRHVSPSQLEPKQRRMSKGKDPVPSLKSIPRMQHLLNFPSNPDKKEIDVIQCVCNVSHNLGILLLDDNGSRISAIEAKHRGDLYAITREVLELWLEGQGKHPVSWETLVVILEKLKKNVVASNIRFSLGPELWRLNFQT